MEKSCDDDDDDDDVQRCTAGQGNTCSLVDNFI